MTCPFLFLLCFGTGYLIHILQSYFTGIRAIVWYNWSSANETTVTNIGKHTVCIRYESMVKMHSGGIQGPVSIIKINLGDGLNKSFNGRSFYIIMYLLLVIVCRIFLFRNVESWLYSFCLCFTHKTNKSANTYLLPCKFNSILSCDVFFKFGSFNWHNKNDIFDMNWGGLYWAFSFPNAIRTFLD